MKIAMLHWAFPPLIGGVESHLALLCPDLAAAGCEVWLLTGAVAGKREEYVWRGTKIIRSPLMDLNSLDRSVIAAQADDIRREMGEFLKRSRPDVVHAHNMHYFSPVHTAALFEAADEMGVPVVLTAHNVWDDPLWREMNRFSGRWAAVIAVSRYIKEELIRWGYPSGRITVVHHGIDAGLFHPPAGDEEAFDARLQGRRVIFHPARMSKDKGTEIGIRALDIMRREFPDVLLLLAGTEKTVDWNREQNDFVKYVHDLIAGLKLQDNVLIRFFPWTEMPRAYRASEICIYPSCFQEPFGLVMLEAMASSRPIVVSRAGGMPEVVVDGVTGYLVKMGDHRELAGRCLQLLRRPVLRNAMGRAGRRAVEKHFTKQIMLEKTLQVYRSLNPELQRKMA